MTLQNKKKKEAYEDLKKEVVKEGKWIISENCMHK